MVTLQYFLAVDEAGCSHPPATDFSAFMLASALVSKSSFDLVRADQPASSVRMD